MRRIISLGLTVWLFACQTRSPEVVIHTAGGGEVVVPVEIADEPEEQRRGLMYRTDLGADAGMLFVSEAEQPRTFWMKNTSLSLDILFIARDGRIVAIAEHTTPFSTATIPSRTPAQNVLEVNAGFVRRKGIAVGDRVTLKRGQP